MGGQAFANFHSNEPIACPRMSPEVYEKVAADIKTKLEIIFTKVTIPREAPGKVDYGDIDFLVSDVRPEPPSEDVLNRTNWLTVQQTIGAKYHVTNGHSHSFALVHPEDPNVFVQVDVELSPGQGALESLELFEWTRFMKSDSDLTQILGIMHRPLGLTCNDRGLHVRLAEIESYNKKNSLLLLTRNPDEAMRFYGLDTAKYWAGFYNEQDLFDWVASGRFFDPELFKSRVEKSNDRSRQLKRPMYRRFVEEYMLSSGSIEIEAPSKWERTTVLEDALKTFQAHGAFHAMMRGHHTKLADTKLWKEIQEWLQSLGLEGNALGQVLRGLKRWVDFVNDNPCILEQPVMETSSQPIWIEAITRDEGKQARLLIWISDNWTRIKELERNREAAAKAARKATAFEVE